MTTKHWTVKRKEEAAEKARLYNESRIKFEKEAEAMLIAKGD